MKLGDSFTYTFQVGMFIIHAIHPLLECKNLSLITTGGHSEDVSPYHITSIIREDMFRMFLNLNVLSFRFFGFSWR